METQQEFIDNLIDYIDKAVLKNSVSNRHVAAVLAFLSEELKKKGVDLDELGKIFLRKDQPDQTNFLLKNLGGLEVGNFQKGFSGGYFDENANGEVESLKVRSFFQAAQYVLNNITVNEGDQIYSAGGNIEVVEQQSENIFHITLRKPYDEYMIPFAVNDLLIGKFNQSGGFFTSYMFVNHVDVAANAMVITLADVSAIPASQNFAPVPLMTLARRGNYTDPARQGIMYLSANDLSFYSLDGVDSFIVSPLMKKAFIGKINTDLESELGLPNSLPVAAGETVVFGDVVIARKFFQVDRANKPIPQYMDRGAWSVGSEHFPYENQILSGTGLEVDQVWNYSSLWRCIVPQATEESKFGSTQWLQVSGDKTLAITFDCSNGKSFHVTNVDTIFTATVWRGTENITDRILDTDWQWTRDTGNAVSDTSWNNSHIVVTRALHIVTEDMGDQWRTGQLRTVKFTVTVFVRDGESVYEETNSINYKQ